MANRPKNRRSNSQQKPKLKNQVSAELVKPHWISESIDTIAGASTLIVGAFTGLAQQNGYTRLATWLFFLTIWLGTLWLIARAHEKNWPIRTTRERPWKLAAFVAAALFVGAASLDYAAQHKSVAAVPQVKNDSERAWLSIDAIHAHLTLGEDITAAVEIKNTGHTPGTIVDLGGMVWLYPKEQQPKDFSNISEHGKVSDLAAYSVAAGDTFLYNPPAYGKLSRENYDSIASGKKVLYCIGKLSYVDAAKIEHHTTWCYYCDPIEKQMIAYHRNNTMD